MGRRRSGEDVNINQSEYIENSPAGSWCTKSYVTFNVSNTNSLFIFRVSLPYYCSSIYFPTLNSGSIQSLNSRNGEDRCVAC